MKTLTLLIGLFFAGVTLGANQAELKGLHNGMPFAAAQKLFPNLALSKTGDAYEDPNSTLNNLPASMSVAVKDGVVSHVGFLVKFSQQYEATGVLQAVMSKFPGMVCDRDKSHCEVVVGKDKVSVLRIGDDGPGALFISIMPVAALDM
jgi:hypothetical protein